MIRRVCLIGILIARVKMLLENTDFCFGIHALHLKLNSSILVKMIMNSCQCKIPRFPQESSNEAKKIHQVVSCKGT